MQDVVQLTGNEETGENNHALTSTRGVEGFLVVKDKVANGGKADKAGEHETGAHNERLATAEVLNDVETTERGAEVDGTQNNLRDKAVGDTGALHDGSTLYILLVC